MFFVSIFPAGTVIAVPVIDISPSIVDVDVFAIQNCFEVSNPKADPEKALCERLITSLPAGLEMFIPRGES